MRLKLLGLISVVFLSLWITMVDSSMPTEMPNDFKFYVTKGPLYISSEKLSREQLNWVRCT